MIQIELVGYDHKLSEVDLQVTKYVNKNLQYNKGFDRYDGK